ncbi:hypothetical protein CFP56_036776 [Quercus suber]|uniref:Uncharacterized protein n=1 Tax=Quercus suber TaxID=58331 RepID=A0AAW0M9X9_QUESU
MRVSAISVETSLMKRLHRICPPWRRNYAAASNKHLCRPVLASSWELKLPSQMCVYGWDERNRNMRMIKTFAFSIDCSEGNTEFSKVRGLDGRILAGFT